MMLKKKWLPLNSLVPIASLLPASIIYWSIIGSEVSTTMKNFLNGRMFDKGINFTFIVLIPKVKNPTTTKEFRLISLCNVIYKLVLKVLTNRLK